MGSVKVERIDHLGIVAGVIQDLGIIDMIDSRIVPDEREDITTGEAIADCKLYTSENAANLAHLPFITRIPGNLKAVGEVIEQSLSMDTWQAIDDQTRYQRVDLCHYGMEQRWLVVYSEGAYQRSGKTLAKAQARDVNSGCQVLFFRVKNPITLSVCFYLTIRCF